MAAVPQLVAQFRSTTLASRQFEVARQIVKTGDRRAIRPLMAALGDRDAHMRASAIHALVRLHATEALPRLRALQ